MKKLALSLMASAVLALSSCSIVMPVAATSNPIGAKVGTSKATIFLGMLYFDQDASIQTAAKNGGIKEISTVDVKYTNMLNIIMGVETIVTGN